MSGPVNRSRAQVGRWALLVGGAGLALFHLALLAERLRTEAIADPLVALRWLAAVALLGSAWALHRRGVAVGRGRTALVFALLALLLHVGGSTPPLALPGGDDLLAAAPLGLAALASVALFTWRSSDLRYGAPPPPRFASSRPAPIPVALDPRTALFVPRPPPCR
jgi:hypothetical protein